MWGICRNPIEPGLVNDLGAKRYLTRKEAVRAVASQIEAGEPSSHSTYLALLLARRLSGKERETQSELREQITEVLSNYVRTATDEAVPVPKRPEGFETVLREIEDFFDQQNSLRAIDPYSPLLTWEAFNWDRQWGAESDTGRKVSSKKPNNRCGETIRPRSAGFLARLYRRISAAVWR